MIGVDGQYMVRFSIADVHDFISEVNFVSLIMSEQAGNVLPEFQLSFILQDDSLMGYLHEGNDIRISYGRDASSLLDGRMAITRLVTKRRGEGRLVSATGIYSALPYVNQSRFMISEPMTSAELMLSRARVYFPSQSIQAPSASDAQRWISPGWSDKKFLSEVWMHSYLPGSFPALAISTDGRFIFRDVRAALAQGPLWKITKDIRDPEHDIVSNDDAEVEVNSGFMNSWMGYGKQQRVYHLEEGTSEDIVASAQGSVVALTKKIARRADIEARFAASGVQNENTHENYWRAYQQNLVGLGSCSSVSVTLSYSGRIMPMRVLDTILFKDDDVGRLRTSASEFNSGLYIITGITRTFMNRQIRTVVNMTRESFNALR